VPNKDLILIGDALIPLEGIKSAISKKESQNSYSVLFPKVMSTYFLWVRYVCGTTYIFKYDNPISLKEDLLALAKALGRVDNC
jgi:hypothetical protein